jgi:predicted small lipoprotein YifL
MKTLISILSLLSVALALGGCATLGPKFTPDGQLPPDRADVYVYRTSAMGAAIAPTVYANKVPLLTLPPSGYFVYRALPGELTLEQHTEATTSVTLDVKAGETYYVKGSVGMGFFVGHPHLVIISKEDGEREVRECKLIPGEVPTAEMVAAGPPLAKK